MSKLVARDSGTPENGEIMVTICLTGGKVSVVGPLANKVLCYGLLEAARDAVRDYQQPSPIVAPARIVPAVEFQQH